MQDSIMSNSLQEAEDFRSTVAKEIDRERQILEEVNKPRKSYKIGWIIALIIVGLYVVLLFLNPVAYLLWLIVAFVLRSFYWISWMVPTTRHKGPKPKRERLKFSVIMRGPLRYLIKKKKRLGLELGTTMLVTGMAPLALSNFILFGIGIGLGIYFGLIRHLYDYNATVNILADMTIILVAFVMMIFIKPQERGFMRMAEKLRGRYTSVKRKGRIAAIVIITLLGFFVAFLGFIFVLSMFAPGGTWQAILSKLEENGLFNLYLLLLILVGEVILLRHFQAVSSRRMIRQYLNARIPMLRDKVLNPLDEVISQARAVNSSTVNKKALEDAKTNYYNTIIFEIFDHNVFGYSQVYVIGPKFRVLLNEDALTHIT
jgi:uncharacterized membrane protein